MVKKEITLLLSLDVSMNYIEFEDDKGVKYGLENQKRKFDHHIWYKNR